MADPANQTPAAAAPAVQESYIVAEGKKSGSTRDVRPEARHDRYYKVVRVRPGDALLNDNWHTNEVFSHTRKNFDVSPPATPTRSTTWWWPSTPTR
jgi:hypothetical protein